MDVPYSLRECILKSWINHNKIVILERKENEIMKKKINIWVIVLFAAIISSFVVGNTEAATQKMKSIQKYRNTAKKIEKKYGLQVVDSSKITYEILVHRKNKVIIERCIGKVTNRNKDGEILNGNGKSSYYISYKGIKCKKNDIVIIYSVFDYC